MKKILLTFFVLSALILSACSSDDSDAAAQDQKNPEKVEVIPSQKIVEMLKVGNVKKAEEVMENGKKEDCKKIKESLLETQCEFYFAEVERLSKI